ncbi:MAG TPA: S8 family serine peptidase [Streptosporangiaceae bacterium]|jgi:hypothetical protein
MLSPRAARVRNWLAFFPVVTCAVTASLVSQAGPAGADTVRDDQLWVLDALKAPQAWPVTKGAGVTVAVIDSGVSPGVSDLAGSVSSGPDLTGVGTPPSDPNWGMHGTWMASLIAGHGHDGGGSGIIGVAPQAHVLSVRVITDRQDPGYARYQRESQQRVQRELAGAIRYAVAHHAKVISMSLGYGRPSRPVRKALQDAYNHDVVVVASSGNSGASAAAHGKNAPYSFPADYPGVLGVGAVKRDGSPAGFSSDNLSVQIAAPGVRVPAQGSDGRYWLVSGTSPACALTAGVAALIKSSYPGLSPSLVREAITTTAADSPHGGYDAAVGFGTVDAPAALAAAGRLSAQAGRAGGRLPRHAVQPGGFFGGGPSAVPAAPVQPRGSRPLVLFSLLGLACLAMVVFATSRLATLRRQPPAGQLPWTHPPGAPSPDAMSPGDTAPGFLSPGAQQPAADMMAGAGPQFWGPASDTDPPAGAQFWGPPADGDPPAGPQFWGPPGEPLPADEPPAWNSLPAADGAGTSSPASPRSPAAPPSAPSSWAPLPGPDRAAGSAAGGGSRLAGGAEDQTATQEFAAVDPQAPAPPPRDASPLTSLPSQDDRRAAMQQKDGDRPDKPPPEASQLTELPPEPADPAAPPAPSWPPGHGGRHAAAPRRHSIAWPPE